MNNIVFVANELYVKNKEISELMPDAVSLEGGKDLHESEDYVLIYSSNED